MSKNVVEPEEPQMTSQYGTHALHTGQGKLHERKRMYRTTRLSIHTHARMHTRTHAHTEQ